MTDRFALFPKPRVRQIGPTVWRVAVGDRTATIGKTEQGGWFWSAGSDACGECVHDEQDAMAAALHHCYPPPPPVGLDRAELAAMIAAAERDRNECTKLMKRLLKLRTGRAWSVRGGSGTGWSWISIDVPKARKIDSAGRRTTKSWGYLDPADRAILGVALGERGPTGHQAESVRPCSGVRSWYLWRISGHAAPDDLRVSEPTWD